MLKLKKVAITGGLAAGKTAVCQLFHSLGAEVVYADAIVHQLLSSDSNIIKAVTDLIGEGVCVGNQLDRSKIAQAVFSNPELLKSLENLLHPFVKRAIDEYYTRSCESGKASLFVAEIPLLFETGADQSFDVTIAVTAKDELRRQRYNQRRHSTEDDFDQREARQWAQGKKAEHATFEIKNNESLEDLRQAVQSLFLLLIQP